MDCVDLRTLAPGYRLVNELTGKPAGKRDDSWELLIPGWSGDVSPYGGELLIASTRGPVMTRKVLAEVPGAVVNQDADDGANVLFHVDHFPTVAKLLRLKRRRTLSPETRAKVLGNLRPFSANPVVS